MPILSRPVSESLACTHCVRLLGLHFPENAVTLKAFDSNSAACGSYHVKSGMVGDAYDVAVLLDCLRAVCDDSEEGPDGELVSVISDETRGLLVTAFRQLLCAFSIAETAHNAEYAVSGPRKDCLENMLAYKQLIVTRKQLMIAAFPAPKLCDYGYAGDYYHDVEAWKVSTLARLEPGDKGFVAWNMAKYRFIKEVHIELRLEFAIEGANPDDVEGYLGRICPDLFAVRTSLA